MTCIPKDVSVDPGPEAVPTTSGSGVRDQVGREQPPVVDGLGAWAGDPQVTEPLEHPEPLVGERPAKGAVENPG